MLGLADRGELAGGGGVSERRPLRKHRNVARAKEKRAIYIRGTYSRH